jgi:phosphoglycerate dehydrogenase-like enzyme
VEFQVKEMKRIKVLINVELSEELKDKIRKKTKVADIVFTADLKETLLEIIDTDALFGYLTPEMFKVAKKLRWIQTPIAGLENYLFYSLIESNIVITNVAGIYNEEIADHVFALITAFSRDLPKLIRCQDQEIWEAHENIRTVPLMGKTLGVIGLGGIGTEVARRGAAFRMRVVATRAHPEKGKPPFIDQIWGRGGLDNLLIESDFVVLCTPHTPTTEKMIRIKELKTMKKTAFLINIGRGVVVDLNDLTEVLRNGDIAGAGLDVFEQEPLPKTHPLWKRSNVIITPHSAAIGLDTLYQERRVNLFIKNLNRFVQGKDLVNDVDKKHWH